MSRQGDQPSRMSLLVALFFVRGALALPALWKSEKFERREKVILTAVVSLWTVVLVVVFYLAGRAVYDTLKI